MKTKTKWKTGIAFAIALFIAFENNTFFNSSSLKAGESADACNEKCEEIPLEQMSAISEEEVLKDQPVEDVIEEEKVELDIVSGDYIFDDQMDPSNRPSVLTAYIYLYGNVIGQVDMAVEDSGSWVVDDLKKEDEPYTVSYSFDGNGIYDVSMNGNSIVYSLKETKEEKNIEEQIDAKEEIEIKEDIKEEVNQEENPVVEQPVVLKEENKVVEKEETKAVHKWFFIGIGEHVDSIVNSII